MSDVQKELSRQMALQLANARQQGITDTLRLVASLFTADDVEMLRMEATGSFEGIADRINVLLHPPTVDNVKRIISIAPKSEPFTLHYED